MEKKLNIGIITHNFPDSLSDRQNAGIFVFDLAQELAKKNDVSVYCPGEKSSNEKMEKVEVQRFGWSKDAKLGSLRWWNPIEIFNLLTFFIQGYRELDKWYVSGKFDVIVAMWSFPAGLFAYFLKQKYGVSYAAWSLGSDIYIYAKKPLLREVIKTILRKAKWCLADGIDLANEVKKLSGKECLFLPSASKIEGSGRKVVEKKKAGITLTFVGRMEPVKGPDIFIDALQKLDGKNNLHINMLGDGSLLKPLKETVKNNGLNNVVTFFGNVSDKARITAILKISDWLVIPDRSGSIPLVFSEGMKAATPVIVSNLADLQTLVKEYNIGYVFKQDNVDSLLHILSNLKDRERSVFAANTKKVAKLFSIEESARRLTQIVG